MSWLSQPRHSPTGGDPNIGCDGQGSDDGAAPPSCRGRGVSVCCGFSAFVGSAVVAGVGVLVAGVFAVGIYVVCGALVSSTFVGSTLVGGTLFSTFVRRALVSGAFAALILTVL